jgi:Zn-dependent protease
MLPYFLYNAITDMDAISIFSLIILVLSIVVHEVAHGYSAYLFGDLTAKYQGRLTFNPIKHIDPFGSIILPFLMSLIPGGVILGWAKPVPINPYNFTRRRLGEFVTAFAGPLSNMVIAAIFIVLIRFAGPLGMTPVFVQLSFVIVLINSVLALFNLIPIPPMDGYRILSVFLPVETVEKFEHFAQRFGMLLVLFFVFFLWNPVFLVLLSMLEVLTGITLS